MFKKKLFILITIIILFCSTIIILEIITKLVVGDFKTAEEYFNHYKINTFQDKNSSKCNWGATLYPHPYLGFVHKRDYNDKYCPSYWINSDGIYSPEYPKKRDENYFDVLVTGGSVAFNLLERNNLLNRQGELKHELETKYLGPNGRAIRVFGGALGAWKQPQQLFNYIMHQNKFDALIAIEGGNEFTVRVNDKFTVPFSINFQIADYPDIFLSVYLKGLKCFYSIHNKFKDSFFVAWALKTYTEYLQKRFDIRYEKSYAKKLFERNNFKDSYHEIHSEENKKYFFSEYEKYIKTYKTLTKSNDQYFTLFFQPVIFHYKPLHEFEKKIDLNNIVLKELYPLFADDPKIKNLKDVYSLISIFKENKEHLYRDYIHFRNDGNEIPGHKIITKEIVHILEQNWKIKKK